MKSTLPPPDAISLPHDLEDLFEDHVSDQAAIAASETCSPNSSEWSSVRNGFEESEEFRASLLPNFRLRWLPSPVLSDGQLWPLHSPPAVSHVGHFDPSLKGTTHNAISLEGNGLSVSPCPSAWRQIARLGDGDTWVMSRYGAKFVDAHALTPEHHEALHRWAISAGFAEMAKVVRVSFTDAESGKLAASLYDLRTPKGLEAAEAEIEALSADEGLVAEWTELPGATALMNQRAGFDVPVALVSDIALTFYAEDVLHDLHGVDGVWWADELAPESFSAPRGVIHLKALDAWNRVQLHRREVERQRDV